MLNFQQNYFIFITGAITICNFNFYSKFTTMKYLILILIMTLTPSLSPEGRGKKNLTNPCFPLSSQERGLGGEVKICSSLSDFISSIVY